MLVCKISHVYLEFFFMFIFVPNWENNVICDQFTSRQRALYYFKSPITAGKPTLALPSCVLPTDWLAGQVELNIN